MGCDVRGEWIGKSYPNLNHKVVGTLIMLQIEVWQCQRGVGFIALDWIVSEVLGRTRNGVDLEMRWRVWRWG